MIVDRMAPRVSAPAVVIVVSTALVIVAINGGDRGRASG